MKEILMALAERSMTEPVLAHVTGIEKDELTEMLSAMIANDLIEERANKFVITNAGLNMLSAAMSNGPLRDKDSLLALAQDDCRQEFEVATSNAQLFPADIEEALFNLDAALKKRHIQNLPVKLAVLERLSALLDPTISAVLLEIQNDLQVAA